MDGRKVPDNIMARMKSVSVEEAWAVMKNAGYGYQVAEGLATDKPRQCFGGPRCYHHVYACPARCMGRY